MALHLVDYAKGDTSEPHLIHAACRGILAVAVHLRSAEDKHTPSFALLSEGRATVPGVGSGRRPGQIISLRQRERRRMPLSKGHGHPGGGAEVLTPTSRRQICGEKLTGKGWLNIHRIAHDLGIRSNSTLLYGHSETLEERVDHMIQLRALQDETGGFQVFIPLAFHPENTAMSELPPPGGATDLRMIAVGRLMLDNFDHIKSYWIMVGTKIAQLAQHFGADDLDGTVVEETIYHMAGAKTPQGMTVRELRGLIREAGRVPVRRDTLYNEL